MKAPMLGYDMIDTLLILLLKRKTELHELSDNSLTVLDSRLEEMRMVIGFEIEGRKIIKEHRAEENNEQEELRSKEDNAEWADNKCSNCGKGIENLIDSREWYENEKPNYCPFCGIRFKESE